MILFCVVDLFGFACSITKSDFCAWNEIRKNIYVEFEKKKIKNFFQKKLKKKINITITNRNRNRKKIRPFSECERFPQAHPNSNN